MLCSFMQTEETTSKTAKPKFIRPIRRKTGIRKRSRPTFTRRCRKAGNMIRKSDCASYLSCTGKYLGLYKSCPGDQLFDATSLVCKPQYEVNCAI
jgi:Chitin binding Peritrophin-A domain